MRHETFPARRRRSRGPDEIRQCLKSDRPQSARRSDGVLRRLLNRLQILAHFGSFLHLQPELDKPTDGPFSTASSQLNAEPFALVLNRIYRSPKNRGSFFQRG